MSEEKIKVELLKYPTEQDWAWVKTCTLNTVGKTSTKAPTNEWKRKLLEAEHSPIRELWFGIKMTIPYWVSVHFVRHHIGVNHYVQSQRNDRQNKYDRNLAPQGEFVSHIMSVNAGELIFMSHKRLCAQASPETRKVMQMICAEVLKVCPEFEGLLVPLCEYRGGICTEMFPCGKQNKKENKTSEIKKSEDTPSKTNEKMTVYTVIHDKEKAAEIRRAIRENGGHCVCAVQKTPDTKCICKEFRERKEPGPCRCGLYEKSFMEK